jgi:hypothetical protein
MSVWCWESESVNDLLAHACTYPPHVSQQTKRCLSEANICSSDVTSSATSRTNIATLEIAFQHANILNLAVYFGLESTSFLFHHTQSST